MRRLGYETVHVKISEFTDDEMLTALINENAGQGEPWPNTVIEAVAAVMMREIDSVARESKPDKTHFVLAGASGLDCDSGVVSSGRRSVRAVQRCR